MVGQRQATTGFFARLADPVPQSLVGLVAPASTCASRRVCPSRGDPKRALRTQPLELAKRDPEQRRVGVNSVGDRPPASAARKRGER